MRRYRKKPVEIEAVEWQDCMTAEIRAWLGATGWSHDFRSGALSLRTLEGVMCADVGDWIIRGVAGEFYPCKPDIFAATYELVEAPVDPA